MKLKNKSTITQINRFDNFGESKRGKAKKNIPIHSGLEPEEGEL